MAGFITCRIYLFDPSAIQVSKGDISKVVQSDSDPFTSIIDDYEIEENDTLETLQSTSNTKFRLSKNNCLKTDSRKDIMYV